MKTFLSFIVYSFYILILLGMAIIFIVPSWFGFDGLEVKIVKSGSMEPSIMTGAVVVIKEDSIYSLNDVITFSSEDSGIPTTHRIIGTENVNGVDYFVTKGDANEERDANLVAVNDILGKVKFDVPFIGFIFDFARQPMGFAFLIGLPAFLIIFDELDKIWREIRRVRQMKITKEMIMPLVIAPYQPFKKAEVEELVKKPVSVIVAKARMMDIKPMAKELEKKPALSLKNKLPILHNSSDIKSRFTIATAGFVMFVVVSGQVGVGDSLSYFSDTEASAVNNMEAQALDFSLSPENSNFSILDGVFEGNDGFDVVIDDQEKDLLFKVNVNFVGGTTTLCDNILVETNSPLIFSGLLPSLSGDNVNFTEPWHLDFSLKPDADYVSGDTCALELSFSGKNEENKDFGYLDTEKVIINFTATDSIIEKTPEILLISEQEIEIIPTNPVMENFSEEIETITQEQEAEFNLNNTDELSDQGETADDETNNLLEDLPVKENEGSSESSMEENDNEDEGKNENGLDNPVL